MKRLFAVILCAVCMTSASAQIQQPGYVATPSASTSILGQAQIAMTNAACNVVTPGSNCTVSGLTTSYLASFVQAYYLTGTLSAPQTLTIPLQPGATHDIQNCTGQVITVGGATGATVAIPSDCTHWYTVKNIDANNYYAEAAASGAITALTGDVTATGPGSVPATLATVNGSPGTCGDATHVCAITTNGKGLTTGQTSTAITFPAVTVPASPSASIQYNNAGAFGGSSNATLDSSGNLNSYSLNTVINAGTSLATAISTCGANPTTIQVTQTITISGTVTVPKNCQILVQSGGFLGGSGTLACVQCTLANQTGGTIFGSSLVITGLQYDRLNWHAVLGYTTRALASAGSDYSVPILQAIAATAPANGTLSVPCLNYRSDSTIAITNTQNMIGECPSSAGDNGSNFVSNHATNNLFSVIGASTIDLVVYGSVKHLSFARMVKPTGTPPTTGVGMYISNAGGWTIDDTRSFDSNWLLYTNLTPGYGAGQGVQNFQGAWGLNGITYSAADTDLEGLANYPPASTGNSSSIFRNIHVFGTNAQTNGATTTGIVDSGQSIIDFDMDYFVVTGTNCVKITQILPATFPTTDIHIRHGQCQTTNAISVTDATSGNPGIEIADIWEFSNSGSTFTRSSGIDVDGYQAASGSSAATMSFVSSSGNSVRGLMASGQPVTLSASTNNSIQGIFNAATGLSVGPMVNLTNTSTGNDISVQCLGAGTISSCVTADGTSQGNRVTAHVGANVTTQCTAISCGSSSKVGFNGGGRTYLVGTSTSTFGRSDYGYIYDNDSAHLGFAALWAVGQNNGANTAQFSVPKDAAFAFGTQNANAVNSSYALDTQIFRLAAGSIGVNDASSAGTVTANSAISAGVVNAGVSGSSTGTVMTAVSTPASGATPVVSITSPGTAAQQMLTIYQASTATNNQVVIPFGVAGSSGNAGTIAFYHTGTNTGFSDFSTFSAMMPERLGATYVDVTGSLVFGTGSSGSTIHANCGTAGLCNAGGTFSVVGSTGVMNAATGSTVNSSLICTAAGAGGGFCNAGTPGTVTSIATTGPITGGTITTTGTIACATCLTATSPTNHGVVLGAGTQALGVTAAGATNSVLIGQGASADPIFSATPTINCTNCTNIPSGLSGMTATQVAIAGSATTITSSKALAGSGAAITTGPTTSVSGNLASFTGTAGQVADSGVAAASVGSPSFTNVTTGTNTTAGMTVGTGASLGTSGSGTINATQLSGKGIITGSAGGSIPTVSTVSTNKIVKSLDGLATYNDSSITDNGTTVSTSEPISAGTGSTVNSSLICTAAGTVVGCPTLAVTNAITTASGPAGVGAISCLTATCTNLRGTYSVAGGTLTTGTFLTLVWPTTTTAYVCTATMNGGATFFGVGNDVATATGMNISAAVTIFGQNVTVNYSCRP